MTPGARSSCVALVAASCLATAHAAEWRAEPSIGMRVDAESNPRLRAEAEGSESMNLALGLKLVRAMPSWEIGLSPAASIRRFTNEKILDADDWRVAARLRKTSERTLIEADFSHADSSTITSELIETGFIEANGRRQDQSASLAGTALLSPRSQLDARVAYSQVDYSDAAATGLVGYSYPVLTLAWSWDMAARWQLQTFGYVSRFEPDRFSPPTESRGLRAGLRRQLGERTQLTVAAGMATTRVAFFEDEGPIYSVELAHQGELSRYVAKFDSEVTPSGYGVLVRRESISATTTRRLSERWTAGASVRGGRDEDFTPVGRPDVRTYGRLELFASWRVRDRWTATFAVSAASQEYDRTDYEASTERAALSLSWTPVPAVVSR